MNVLLITNNLFRISEDRVYTDANTSSIITRFAYLGKIRICGVLFNKKTSMILDQCVDNISVDDVISIKKGRMFPYVKSLKVIEEEVKKCDLVIGYHSPCVNAEVALKFSQKYNKKYLSYVVACAWDGFWNHGIIGKLCAPIRFFSLKKVVRKSDYVLYVTNEFLQNRYPNDAIKIGCSDVKIKVGDDFILKDRIDRINLRNDNDDINLVTVAALSVRYKGQQFVIKALSELKRQGIKNIHYYLIGYGSKTYLEKLAIKYKVEDNVHIIGSLSHNDIFNYLDKMDVYIQPSLQEGLPRSLVEAMSRGLLCIGAETAGIPELLERQYVVKRKSVNDIVKILSSINKDQLIHQAIRNYEEAQSYSEEALDHKRKGFFELILSDIKKQ